MLFISKTVGGARAKCHTNHCKALICQKGTNLQSDEVSLLVIDTAGIIL